MMSSVSDTAGRFFISGHGMRINVSDAVCFRSLEVREEYGIPNDSRLHIIKTIKSIPMMYPNIPAIRAAMRSTNLRKTAGPLSSGTIRPVIQVKATIITIGRLTNLASTDA